MIRKAAKIIMVHILAVAVMVGTAGCSSKVADTEAGRSNYMKASQTAENIALTVVGRDPLRTEVATALAEEQSESSVDAETTEDNAESVVKSQEELSVTSAQANEEASEASAEESSSEQTDTCDHEWLAVTETISHPAEYETIHHDAKSHLETQKVEGEDRPSVVFWDEVLERDVWYLFSDGKQIHVDWTYYVNPNKYDRWWVGICGEGSSVCTSVTYYDQTEQPPKPEYTDNWVMFGTCSISEYPREGDIAISGEEAMGYYASWSGCSWSVGADYHYIRHTTYLDEGGRTEDVEYNEIGRSPFNEDGYRIASNCHPDGEEYVYILTADVSYETVTVIDEEAWDEEVLVREAWTEESVLYYECTKCGERK